MYAVFYNWSPTLSVNKNGKMFGMRLCESGWFLQNNEFQVYTSDPLNSFVQDGSLHIKPVSHE